ncbi:MAG TPA: glutaminyl-peptide cyclotransferase [Natronosporangium sp.]
MKRSPWLGAALAVLLVGCGNSGAEPTTPAAAPAGNTVTAAQLTVEVIERYPHDTDAFTQGLEVRDGVLYESTGLYGQSDVRTVDQETGEVIHSVPLPATMFGEGLTLVDDKIWQITWQEQTAFLRDAATLEEIDQFSYTGEGWGICYDRAADRLVMSDGTDRLTFRDPATFEETGSVTVTRDGQPQRMINELECLGDTVWANVWQTDEIIAIDPATGVVESVVNAAGLLTPEERSQADVLNGIAAVPSLVTQQGDGQQFLITGKLWPWLFLVRFVPA